MKGCVCLLAVLVFAVSAPAFSQTYNLTASWSDGGLVIPASVTVASGSDQTFMAIPDPGYQVDKWYLYSREVQVGGLTYTISNVQANQEIYITFKKIGYTITATAGLNGEVRPQLSVVSPGSNGLFTAIPDIGYKVDKWYLDDGVVRIGGNNFRLTDIQADHRIHVSFRRAAAYSLESIEFENEQDFKDRIISNNTEAEEPDKALVLIERIPGVGPKPGNAVMRMQNIEDSDPNSPNYGRIIHARLKVFLLKRM
jgi:hypothetical protein